MMARKIRPPKQVTDKNDAWSIVSDANRIAETVARYTRFTESHVPNASCSWLTICAQSEEARKEEEKAMKISDEIRKWCDNADADGDACGELRDLADRIDREMVELPKDMDGVPIHVGDTAYGCRSGMKMIISELRMTMNGWSISTSSGYLTDAKVTHERPDSWERVAYDLETVVPIDDDGDMRFRRELADRIRKLVEKEGQR